jgi:uncharacterized protein
MMKLLLVVFAAAPALATPSERALIASAALAQVGVTRQYDASYAQLRYPGGDIPLVRGVCADVVVRAFRRINVDLQATVHEDMSRNFAAYPQLWQLRRPDTNIDHRRVPNLMRYFERKGKAVSSRAPYEPGDVVAWRLRNGLHHIGVVSNVKNSSGSEYLVVHNIGYGTQNEDVLRSFAIIGHYRW